MMNLTPIDRTSERDDVQFINIGSGNWRLRDWHNLDAPSEHYKKSFDYGVDIPHNLMSMSNIPITSTTVDAAYTSHVIEHISSEASSFLFSEVFRILKPQGVFRITCPDMKLIFQMFAKKDEEFFKRFAFRKAFPNITLEQAFLHCFAAVRTKHIDFPEVSSFEDHDVRQRFAAAKLLRRCPRINDFVLERALDAVVRDIPVSAANARYPQCHVNWWTHRKLHRALRRAGFKQTITQRRRKSECQRMQSRKHFNNTRPWMSLYVEAIK